MTVWLKQSTAVTVKVGPFLDETDGKTAETALTITQADVRLSKNGGDMAQKGDATSLTHDEIGWYDCPLSTTDTGTLGSLVLMVHEGGALPVFLEFMVVPANVWDSFFGADRLQVDALEISSDSVAADNLELAYDGTGYGGGTVKPGVDVVSISGSTVAADNLEEGAESLVVGAVNDAGATTTVFITNLTEATNNHYNGRVVNFKSGAMNGQSAAITGYNGTTKALTVSTMTEAPANGVEFVIS